MHDSDWGLVSVFQAALVDDPLPWSGEQLLIAAILLRAWSDLGDALCGEEARRFLLEEARWLCDWINLDHAAVREVVLAGPQPSCHHMRGI